MRLLVLLCLLLPLSGCNQDPVTEQLHDYAYRVGNAIDQDIDLQLSDTLPSYPARRDRLLEVVDIREGMLDALDLRRCGLLTLIGERNSSLGKLAGFSQRLIYEIRFLPPLRACIESLESQVALNEDEQELLERLLSIHRIKQQNLPRVLANAVFNTEEMEQQFALGATPASQEQLNRFTLIDPALQRLAYLSELTRQHDWAVPKDIDRLEDSYHQLYLTPFGAEWLKSLSYLTQTLNQTAESIEKRLARRPLCFNRKPTPQARIIRNVFEQYYAAQLQPWMSAVHRSGQRWHDFWQEITLLLPMTPELEGYFADTLLSNESLWAQYIQARDRHTRSWQRLLGQCGLMPSG